jgi:hypothetical protein
MVIIIFELNLMGRKHIIIPIDCMGIAEKNSLHLETMISYLKAMLEKRYFTEGRKRNDW